MTQSFGTCGSPVEAVSPLGSEILCPAYGLRVIYFPSDQAAGRPPGASKVVCADSSTLHVLSLGEIDSPLEACSCLVVRIDAIESHTGALQVAGYAIINVFLLKNALDNATVAAIETPWTNVVLNEGAFQMPLHMRPPNRGAPLTHHSLEVTSPRVPCATILARIRRVSPAEYGASFTAAKEGLRGEGVSVFLPAPPPPPAPRSGAYDSSRAWPSPSEVVLYPKRAAQKVPTIDELLLHYSETATVAAGRLNMGGPDAAKPTDGCAVPEGAPILATLEPSAAVFGIPPLPRASSADKTAWVLKRLAGVPTEMLDFDYIAPYDPALGVKVRVDGGHALPLGRLLSEAAGGGGAGLSFSVTHTLLPSSAAAPPAASVSTPTLLREWTEGAASAACPRFLDNWATHVRVAHAPGVAVLVCLYAVPLLLTGGLGPVFPVGWGLLPLFDAAGEGYVARGAFCVPLFAGAVPSASTLDAIAAALASDSFASVFEQLVGVRPLVNEALKGLAVGEGGVPWFGPFPALFPLVEDEASVLVRIHDAQLMGVLGVEPGNYQVPAQSALSPAICDAYTAWDWSDVPIPTNTGDTSLCDTNNDALIAAAMAVYQNMATFDVALNVVFADSTGVSEATAARTETRPKTKSAPGSRKGVAKGADADAASAPKPRSKKGTVDKGADADAASAPKPRSKKGTVAKGADADAASAPSPR